MSEEEREKKGRREDQAAEKSVFFAGGGGRGIITGSDWGTFPGAVVGANGDLDPSGHVYASGPTGRGRRKSGDAQLG